MSALTASRSAPALGQDVIPKLLDNPTPADNVHIWGGAMVAVDSSGYYRPAANGGTCVAVVGIADQECDNTVSGHAAGGIPGTNIPFQVRSGTFKMNNSASADLIATANVGQDCFVVDDNTVALTDGNGTRLRAGKVFGVESDGVWVTMSPVFAPQPTSDSYPETVISIPVTLASIATGAIAKFTPGFAGRIKSLTYVPSVPSSTAAKAATITPEIASTPLTGGVLALTTANTNTLATNVAGTAVTALNTFTAAQEIELVASAVTTFVEGSGSIQIVLG
jgi:hypothetical protein